jgi:chlorophyll synthase
VRQLHLFVRMLRYRVALMLWMFLLLAAAYRDGLAGGSWPLACSAFALASTYVAATAVNDVADREIDLVNHPRDPGRPLVTGEATVNDLLRLHQVAAVLALLASVPLGPVGLGVVALSLVIAWVYSLPPFALSHRTLLAPLALAVAYVLVPYTHGLIGVGVGPTAADARFAAALFALFVARIVLKDFRDRDGDARYGKPTLLLRAGKGVTCVVSLGALGLGDAALVTALRPPAAIAFVLQLFVAGAVWMVVRLWRADDRRDEQVAIGTGARAGNGLLAAALAWLVLDARGAPLEHELALVAAIAGAFAIAFATVAIRPQDAIIGYKG